MDHSSTFSNPSPPQSTSSAAGGKAKISKKKKVGGGGGGTMKLSTDPQSVAARQRRHRISDRFKILRSLVPGGSRLDTVSMLEEAIEYVKFLKTQVWLHQAMIDLVGDGAAVFQQQPDDEYDCCAGAAVRPSHDCQQDVGPSGGYLGGHVEAGVGDVAMAEWWVSGDAASMQS